LRGAIVEPKENAKSHFSSKGHRQRDGVDSHVFVAGTLLNWKNSVQRAFPHESKKKRSQHTFPVIDTSTT
jgi:hypothetical protein